MHMILWLPYYFGKIGFEQYAAIITFVYPVSSPFSVLLYNFVAKRVSISEEYLMCLFLALSTFILGGLSFLPSENLSIAIYMILLALVSLAQGGPRNFAITT